MYQNQYDKAIIGAKATKGLQLTFLGLASLGLAPLLPGAITELALGYPILASVLYAEEVIITAAALTGTMTTAFGLNEIHDGATGYNFMAENIYGGDYEAYEAERDLFEGLSSAILFFGLPQVASSRMAGQSVSTQGAGISSSFTTGHPEAISRGMGKLSTRQATVLEQLPKYGSQTIIPKRAFNTRDLSALSAATGDEFAMFTRGSQRMIIRGDAKTVPVNSNMARDLAAQGWRWSGHVHPDFTLYPSMGDREVLRAMGGRESAIYDPYGRFQTFTPDGLNMQRGFGQ